MNHTPFEYGGKPFIPERRFEPQGQYHSRIPLSHMREDTELDLNGLDEFAYSHSDFYAASTTKDCDIFRCMEDGRLYVPCEDGLQLYEDRPDPERGREHDR